MIAPALATGRLTLLANVMVRELLVEKNGKAKGVSFIDKLSGAERRLFARVIVVAASACESARLLLNSRSAMFPQGLANSSGVVGRYLTDTISVDGEGYFPQLEKFPPHNHDGTGGGHVFIPWWRFNEHCDFACGYFIEFGGGPKMPCSGTFYEVGKRVQGYGRTLKEQCRRLYGTSIYFSARGEMIPNEDSYCELDPYVTDEWGIPVLRFHFQWGENEIKMAKDMHRTIRNIIESAGGHYLSPPAASTANGLSIGGTSYHEVGTVRMGTSPANSALNEFCQAHDVKNLFVVDGACFPSHPEKPPTLSIMALSWRASEYLVEMSRKGSL
jgi:choline dehydrogenase-like flavoprotein